MRAPMSVYSLTRLGFINSPVTAPQGLRQMSLRTTVGRLSLTRTDTRFRSIARALPGDHPGEAFPVLLAAFHAPVQLDKKIEDCSARPMLC
jgi:hypothetical protein